MSRNSLSAACFIILVTFSPLAFADTWLQTDWSGGAGQLTWADTSRFYESWRMNGILSPGDLHLDTPNDSIWSTTGVLAGASAARCLAEDLTGNVYCGTGLQGDVFESANDGETWTNTANIPTALSVYSLISDSNDNLWAGIDDSGDVFISTDHGASWTPTDELVGAVTVTCLLEAGGSVYAGTYSGGDVFRTTDDGASWLTTGNVTGATDIMSMMVLNDTVWAGTYPNGDVFISTDQGATWEAKGDLAGVEAVLSMLHASDDNIYAGTSWTTGVYKTTDRGASWTATDPIPGTTLVRALTQVGQSIYASSRDLTLTGRIFKSTDGGGNWTEVFNDPNSFDIYSLLYTTKGFLFAGAEKTTGAGVYRAGYFPSGYLVSSVYNAPGGYGALSWSVTSNGMTEIVRVRTDVNPDMSTAPAWGSCPPVANGQDISGLSSVSDTHEYVQYRIEMSSSNNARSPFLHWINLVYGTVVPRDVGVVQILTPEPVVQPGTTAAPSALVSNFGARAESMWVFCEIDSVSASPSIVYLDSVSVTGLAPAETTLVTFRDWTAGPSGSVYSLCVFATVPDDTGFTNDTLCTQIVSFLSLLEMFSNFFSAPVIDGIVSPGEWDSANVYDISDIYGDQGTPNLPASCFARFLHDDDNLYVLVTADRDTLLQIGDKASLLIDEDNDGTWAPGDVEGEYFLTRMGIDTIWFIAYPGLAEYQVVGASVAMGDSQTTIVEAAIPFGGDGPLLDAQPGDTLGLFMDFMDQETSDYLGWWPQPVPDSLRGDPVHFGSLILEPGTGVQNSVEPKTPSLSRIVAVKPNPFRGETRILYTIGEQGSDVSLSIYDASGRLARRLLSRAAAPGFYSLTWDGRSDDGKRLNSGVYLLRMKAGSVASTRKLTLLD